MWRVACGVAALLAIARPALAAPPEPEPPDARDPVVAGGTSGLVTTAGVALVIASRESHLGGAQTAVGMVGLAVFAVGPTTGHGYAGHAWNEGLGMRLASVTGVVAGALLCEARCQADTARNEAGLALIAGGILGYTVAMAYEIVTAPRAARDFNRAHGAGVQLSVLPVRDARDALAPTVGLAARF